MNKNVLYIVEDDISLDNGSGINERIFIKSLLEKGVTVLISKPQQKLDDSFQNHKNLFTTKKQLDRRKPLSYFLFMLQKTHLIRWITKKNNINVYVFRWGPLPLDVFYFGLFFKNKIFLKHFSFLRTTQKSHPVFHLVYALRFLIIKLNLISGADTPSVITKKLVTDNYGIKEVLVAKNGTENSRVMTNEKYKDFIYIGRLSKKRNTDQLLEAFKKSNREIDIYGFGEMESLVQECAKNYKNINFYGKIDFESLKKELPRYKFGVDFTFVPTNYGKASYSQKIAQYLSFGLNVLAIDCEDNKFIEDNDVGTLVDLENNSLEKKINTLVYKPVKTDDIEEFIFNEAIVKKRIRFWNQ